MWRPLSFCWGTDLELATRVKVFFVQRPIWLALWGGDSGLLMKVPGRRGHDSASVALVVNLLQRPSRGRLSCGSAARPSFDLQLWWRTWRRKSNAVSPLKNATNESLLIWKFLQNPGVPDVTVPVYSYRWENGCFVRNKMTRSNKKIRWQVSGIGQFQGNSLRRNSSWSYSTVHTYTH